jgi:hypothetical protein
MSGAAFGAIAMANNLARMQQGLAQARERWPQIAPELRYAEGAPVAALGQGLPELVGELEGVALRLRAETDVVFYATTEILAQRPFGGGEVGVYPSPAGLLGRVRQWLGGDVEVGDPDFDTSFLVTSEVPGEAAAWLQPALRAEIAALAGHGLGGLVRADGQVRLLLYGVVTDEAVLSAALGLALRAARA